MNVLLSAFASATEGDDLQNQQLSSAVTDIVRRETMPLLQTYIDAELVRVLTVTHIHLTKTSKNKL